MLLRLPKETVTFAKYRVLLFSCALLLTISCSVIVWPVLVHHGLVVVEKVPAVLLHVGLELGFAVLGETSHHAYKAEEGQVGKARTVS